MLRWMLGTFLVLHGVTHAFFPSYGTYDSWLLGDARSLALMLIVLATGLFTIAGLGVLLNVSWWRSATLVAAVESFLFLALFWEMGLIVGVGIDLAIIASLLSWAKLPRSGVRHSA